VTAYVKASQICVMFAKPWLSRTIEACVTEIMQFFTSHKITQNPDKVTLLLDAIKQQTLGVIK